MRIIFVGAVESANTACARCCDTTAMWRVFSHSPRNAHLFNADYADLAPLCAENCVPCFRIRNINDEDTATLIRSLKPDVVFVFGWSQIVELPSCNYPGWVASVCILPSYRNRGRHPLMGPGGRADGKRIDVFLFG